ncbi:MAG: HEAT repeat domain-containing protein, partial [Fimbriimonadales bacterium]
MSCSSFFFVMAVAQGQQPGAIGLWSVDFPGKVSGATQGIWQDSKLRINKDGTFKQYGGLGLSGRYTMTGSKLHLTIERLFYRNAQFGKAKAMYDMLHFDKGLDLLIRRPDLLEIVPLDQLRGQSRVVWRPAKRESVKALLTQVSKIETNDDSNKIGDYVYDEMAERRLEAIPVLRELLLKDPDRDLRYWSAALLGHVKATEAVPDLVAAFDDKRRGNASAAARALGEIGSKEAVLPIISAMKAKKISGYTGAQA